MKYRGPFEKGGHSISHAGATGLAKPCPRAAVERLINNAGGRVTAPPVYRPEPSRAAASTAMIQPRKAAWPPVDRSQAKPSAPLQGTGKQVIPRAAAPPVYRPQFPNCGLQQKLVSTPITAPAGPTVAQPKVWRPASAKVASVAPPIYRPPTAAVRPVQRRMVGPSGSNPVLPSRVPGGQHGQAGQRQVGFQPRPGGLPSFTGPKVPQQTSAPPVFCPQGASRIQPESVAGSQPPTFKPPSVYRPVSGSPNIPPPLQPKQSRFVADIKPSAGAPVFAAVGNPGRPGTIQASKVKGFFKFVYAWLPGSSQRQVSRYRLRSGARTKFAQSLLTHETNREFYRHQHLPQEVDTHRQGLTQWLVGRDLPDLPRNIDVTTVTRRTSNGGVYGKGQLNASASFVDEGLQERVPDNSPNRLEAELGEDRAGNKFVDVNTLYTYPIGSGIGQILLYEAAYLAVSNSYSRFTLGMGEGQAANMWGERYRDYIIDPPDVAPETEALVDDRPAPKRAVSSFNMLIGAWAGLANQWEKLSCCSR